MHRKTRLVAVGLFLLQIVFIGAAFPQQVGPFVKYEDNPILEPQGTGFEQKAVFNPAAIMQSDTIYLLYRAEDTTGAGQWNGTSRIGLAWSTDGIHFTRRAEPVIFPQYDYETPGGCEDPRIVKVGDTYYLTYTAYDGHTARLALATSQDLIHWNKYGPILSSLGWSKSGAIVAEEINGQYIMYFGDSNMWIAYSDDLINWTVDPNPVMRPRSGYFDANLVEPGPPPVLMEEGILLIYSGSDGQRYSTGWVLFSKDDPTHILTRAEEPILVPEKDWERFGQVDNVVFSEGLVNYNDIWYLYYGGADTRIGVAMCEGPIYIGVEEHAQRGFPTYSLSQNYLNPFYTSNSIELSLKECGRVSLKVLDLAGREVITLVDRQMEAGTHRVVWKPAGLPSGVYFCMLSVNGFKQTRKFVFLK